MTVKPTPRVVLDMTCGEPDADWLAELLEWRLPWPQRSQDRCVALVAMVAARWPAVQARGAQAWPTLDEVASALGAYAAASADVVMLLTVAVAGGWIRYEDVPG